MLVFTIPKCIRTLTLRDRSLIGVISRIAYESTRRFLAAHLRGIDGTPYFIVSTQLWGNALNAHVHWHALVSCALKTRDGTLHHLPERLDLTPLTEIFRHAVLKALKRRGTITEEFYETLRTWKHGGFSTDASVLVPPGDAAGLERVAAYVLRPPLSLARLTYTPGSKTAIYRTSHTPVTGGNFVAFDAKELLVRLLCLVPTPYFCLVRYYGAASATWRHDQAQRPLVAEAADVPEPPPKKRRTGSIWARLLKRVYGIDPLICPKCSSQLEVIAFIHDAEVIEKILRHLHRWDPPRAPPG